MKKQDILTIRNQLGLSQKELAEKLGVKRLTIARWESGKTKPNAEYLAMLEKLAPDTSVENVSPPDTPDTNVSDNNVSGSEIVSPPDTKNVSSKQDFVSPPDTNVSGKQGKCITPDTNDTTQADIPDTKNDNFVSGKPQNVSSPDTKAENVSKQLDTNVRAYYEAMYSDAEGVISLCTINQPKDSDHKPSLHAKGFYDISQIPDLLIEVDKLNGDYHIYTGLHPLRERPSVGRGGEKDILGVALFAADVDAKDVIDDPVEKQKANEEKAFYQWTDELLSECKSKALEHIRSVCERVSLPPTAIIDSGHGYYPIFKLDKFIKFKNDQHREELKKVNQALHKAFAADSTFDFARILRVPGTRNIKPGYPADCELMEFHPDRRYTLDDIRKVEELTAEASSKKESKPKPQTISLDDQTLLEKAKNARNGAKFTALWEGNTAGYKSQSEADCALCCLLAHWTSGDRERIDRLFRQSGLYRDDKWGEREDYRERTINAALERTTKFYDPNYQSEQSPQDIISEINLEQTPETIQKRLWDFVTDASHWTPTELGRFCDDLNIEHNLTKTWLRGWKRAVISEKQRRKAQEQKFITDEKPTIVITDRFMREVTDDIISAINRINSQKPFLFVRSGMPTRVELDENDNAIAKPLTVSAARGIMERAANFVSEIDVEGEVVQTPVNPPLDNVNDFLSLGGFPNLPPLVGISTAPIVAPDGTICVDEGYHPAIRYFYYAKQKLEIGDITPTPENVEKSKQLILDELLCDFPFANQASRANTVALMLNPFVRPLIQGATPLYAIDASTPGTGKTLLADVASMPFIPSGPPITTAGRDDDEWRKRITAKLMNAPSHILIDNVKLKLTSGDLSAALTAYEWEDRILGQSATIRLPVKCTWIATGNNLELSDEIARRSVWIRLDPKVERPWERTGFKHKDLRGWVRSHRGEIVTALLTLIRKWLADGRPESDVTLGSYEEWVKVVGGILKVVGIDGFLENANELYEQLDADRRAWVEFFDVWAEKYGAYDEESGSWGVYIEPACAMHADRTDSGAPIWEKRDSGESVGTKELFPLASHFDDNPNEGLGILDAYLGSKKEQARRVNLGRQLQKRKDRVFGNYRLEILPQKKNRAIQYQLVKVTNESGNLDS